MQLQVRVPSMLIRRDGLMAQPYPMAHNFEMILSRTQAAPIAGYLQQREVTQLEDVEKDRADLIAKATAAAGKSVTLVAKKWLSV